MFEGVTTAYLVHRNTNYDRINAAFLVPFLVQSCMQVLIFYILDDSTDGLACGRWSTNWLLSFMQVVFVAGVPYFWAWLSFVECTLIILSSGGRENPSQMRQMLKMLNLEETDVSKVWPRRLLLRDVFRPRVRNCAGNGLIFISSACIYFAVRSFYPRPTEWEWWNMSWLVPGPICTTRGKWDFQVMPIAVFGHWSLKYIFAACFWFSSTAYNCIPHPSLMPFAVEVCGLLGLVITIFTDTQWASLWSLSASLMYAIALFEPALFKKGRVLDSEALVPEGEDLRKTQIFTCAWSRFSLHKVTPWNEELQRQCEHCEDHDEDDGGKETDTVSSCILQMPTLMTMGDVAPKPSQSHSVC